MALGNEMAVKAAMNMVFKMFGIDAEQTKEDVLKAVSAILTFDTRLAEMERTQTQILDALRENENGGQERSYGEYPGGSTYGPNTDAAIRAATGHSDGTIGQFATEHFERGADIHARPDWSDAR